MNTVQELEKQLEENKKLIAQRQAAQRLSQNADFKKLILEGFCEKECARYARESGDPAIDAEGRADALAMAQAAGHLLRYLSLQIQMGAHAERTIQEVEEELAEARAEEIEG